jgi:hypothetical protein
MMSHRVAEHGHWTLYWNPRERRTFCHDKRAESVERYFWLPDSSGTPLITEDAQNAGSGGFQLQKVLKLIQKLAKESSLLYLKAESEYWLAELLRIKPAAVQRKGVRDTVSYYRDKLDKANYDWKDLCAPFLADSGLDISFTTSSTSVHESVAVQVNFIIFDDCGQTFNTCWFMLVPGKSGYLLRAMFSLGKMAP